MTPNPSMDTSSSSLGSQTDPVELELDRTGSFMTWAAVVAPLFLSQIAYNLSTFPVSLDLVSYAVFASYLLVSGWASIGPLGLILFIMAIALAALRISFSSSDASWTSLLLLFALYAPLPFRVKSDRGLQAVQSTLQDVFVAAATIISVIAIVQLAVVNAVKIQALMNIHFVLPEAVRSAGTYTYSREGAGFVKANGYFLRESSTLSQVAALAIIIEYYGRARWRILGILGAGLVSSFSGSGMLALLAGLLLPRSVGRIPAFIAALTGTAIVLLVLNSADVPFLNAWFGRLDEFTTPNTSGYARFVAPFDMITHSFDNGSLSTWFGNGAGSYLRETSLLKVRYEINDPTWAKLIYEYGILGFFLIVSLVVARLYSSNLCNEGSNFLLFVWLLSGQLLKPDFVLIMWLLTVIPKAARRSTISRYDPATAPA